MKCVCAIRILLLRDVRPRHPGLELLLSLGQQALAEVLRDLVVGQGPELRPLTVITGIIMIYNLSCRSYNPIYNC